MDSRYWQSQFEDWLRHHHQEQDAAHDISHFRRVWATAQTLGKKSCRLAGGAIGMLFP